MSQQARVNRRLRAAASDRTGTISESRPDSLPRRSTVVDGRASASQEQVEDSRSRADAPAAASPEAESDLRWVMIRDGHVELVSPAYVVGGGDFNTGMDSESSSALYSSSAGAPPHSEAGARASPSS